MYSAKCEDGIYTVYCDGEVVKVLPNAFKFEQFMTVLWENLVCRLLLEKKKSKTKAIFVLGELVFLLTNNTFKSLRSLVR